jgi:hypothetical protein
MEGWRVLAGILLLAAFTHAEAVPVAPGARDVAQYFSATVQDSFTLLADTDDPTLVYYIPRRGGVAVQSPQSSNPLPRFQIFSRVPLFGFFAGEELVQLGGSLSTTSDLGALSQLQQEASAQGFRTAPAPAKRATTRFLVSGYELSDGRLDVECTIEQVEVTDRHGQTRVIRVPRCFTRQSPDEPYSLDTNVMYQFVAFAPSNRSVVAQDIPFQATTLPGWTQQLRTLMETGAQWDNILSARIDWEIQTSQLTRQARLHVNWSTLFERVSAFAAVRHFSCVDAEVRALFEQLIQCSQENECGIRIEYLQPDGTWGPQAPNDDNFVNVVNAVQQRLRDELFNEVQQHIPPAPDYSTGSRRSFFTLRANYEKLLLERNEIVPLTWNPGPTDVSASTQLNIYCLLGGFEYGRVSWHMEDQGCRQLLGQQ